ncbi:MAG: YeeE/YedE family protein [Saprospiraceae bacterium]|nr:YeeE/YedE family protein [Saprospiraceae bacterium]
MIKDFITSPWPWYVAGPVIAFTMFGLIYFGKNFGVSGNLRTICAAGGGGRLCSFFDFNWKGQVWNLVFVLGTILGGFIAAQYLTPEQSIELSSSTVNELEKLGFTEVGNSYLPAKLFGESVLSSGIGILILVGGGFLVGFGARYAGGCTSGHAISGLSNLQIPSLIAVIGFFIGGLSMVYFIMPVLFG